MKTCPDCGKEYPDEEVSCSSDGQLLVGGTTPLLSDPLESTMVAAPIRNQFAPLKERWLLVFEIGLVCFIAFGNSTIYSISVLFGVDYGNAGKDATYWMSFALHEGTALGLLWYVLLRRSRTLADLGLSRGKNDLGWSLLLWFGGSMLYYGVYKVIYASGLISNDATTAVHHVGEKLFSGGVSAMTMLFILVNPFFEELIVRAYLMTEIRRLTNSTVISVILSVSLQMSYHLYQGLPLALSGAALFLLFSIYYAKTNRIIPVILAHLYMDALAMLAFLRHG